MRNLFFLPLAVFLTGCIGSGGGGSGYGIGAFDFMDTGGKGNYTYDSLKDSGSARSDFCGTGEHPPLFTAIKSNKI